MALEDCVDCCDCFEESFDLRLLKERGEEVLFEVLPWDLVSEANMRNKPRGSLVEGSRRDAVGRPPGMMFKWFGGEGSGVGEC